MVRVVAIGDIGVLDSMVHIGDEAMFEEFVVQMRARGIHDIVALSSNPDETRDRYGLAAIRQIGFTGGPPRAELDERLDRVIRTAGGETDLLAADDPAHPVIAAIRDADGVAITGGGNLSSIWPTNIVERAAVASIARVLGIPLVVSGQTLGPVLTDQDAVVVAELLRSAALVGVRESASLAVARGMRVNEGQLQLTVDDASFLAAEEAPFGGASSTDTAPPTGTGGYCVVTLAAHLGDADRESFLARVAALLDRVVEHTGLEIVLSAHFGSLDTADRRGDTVMHDAVAERMTSSRVRSVTPTDSPAAAVLALGASLAITSRYHPAVFAVSAGVPTVGIPVDGYTTVKLTGALGNFGQSGILPVDTVIDGDGFDLVADVWAARADIRSTGREMALSNRAGKSAWWDRVAAAFAR